MAPSFAQALAFWFKLGWISFGGPAGQIALLHQELVERRRWISESQFLHALNYCMLLPGPEAQQLATYMGWSLHGIRGGVAAGALFVLPSLFILIGLSWLYLVQGQQPLVVAVLDGLKPAVVAVVVAAAWRLGRRVLHHRLLVGVAVAAFMALAVFKAPFPLVVAGAALVGWGAQGRWPQAFVARGAQGAGGAPGAPGANAANDANGARGGHGGHGLHAVGSAGGAGSVADVQGLAGLASSAVAPPGRLNTLTLTGVFVLLWGGSLGGLAIAFGWHATLTQMGWFFTQAALLTFGGAYAVLPFVMQAAVEQRGWLTATQMMDGLALGETTPGPLIMVVAFVGFVGAWGQALFGPEQRLLAGVVAAVVVTWFTFLPSFLFILVGAPWVNRLHEQGQGRGGQGHGQGRLQGPLTAITAAVVGVILNLALTFAHQVLWPASHGGLFQWPALVVGLVTGWLLMRRGWGVVPVLGLAAALGLVGHGAGVLP